MSTEPLERTEPEDPEHSIGQAWYVVAVLMVVYVFSFADRQILVLMVEDLKTGLGLTQDWQVSILMGPAFAIFYAIFGFPLGRLADRTQRRSVVAAGLTVWSLLAAGCGVARNFWQMALFRIGVGVGEASLSPSAYSLISDYFPKRLMATAISVYSTGIYIGTGLALLMGGAVIVYAKTGTAWNLPIFGTIDPWQQVFVIVGLAGVLVVPLLYTFPEPRRRGAGPQQPVPLPEVAAYLKANWQTITCHTLGFALLSFSSYGSGAWTPTYYIRNFGWTQGQTAFWNGIVIMIFGTLGITIGGRLADRLAKQGHRDAKMRVGFIASVVWFPFGIAFPLMPTAWLALAVSVGSVLTASMPFGVAAAAIQEMMPNRMRGQASAIYLFGITMIGMAFGPTILAILSDYVFGQDRIQFSLVTVGTVAHVLSAIFLWTGLKHFVRSLDYLAQWTASESAE
ncbi:MAG: MFS transporter [Acidobacteriota bacterium]|nr:MFS transporter [Acidobacteriota bacterium]